MARRHVSRDVGPDRVLSSIGVSYAHVACRHSQEKPTKGSLSRRCNKTGNVLIFEFVSRLVILAVFIRLLLHAKKDVSYSSSPH